MPGCKDVGASTAVPDGAAASDGAPAKLAAAVGAGAVGGRGVRFATTLVATGAALHATASTSNPLLNTNAARRLMKTSRSN